MRAIRVVFDLENIPNNSLLQTSLGCISWDYRGIINQIDGELLVMCECIYLDVPPPPPGFSLNGVTVDKHLEKWQNKSLNHILIILKFNLDSIGKYFINNDLTILAGTNLTSKGLIVQLSGSGKSITELINELKKYLSVRSISSAKGGKGMITETISSDEYKILKKAYSSGWYDSPKSTNLRKLAKELGVSKSTVSNHINSSEGKIIGNFFESDLCS